MKSWGQTNITDGPLMLSKNLTETQIIDHSPATFNKCWHRRISQYTYAPVSGREEQESFLDAAAASVNRMLAGGGVSVESATEELLETVQIVRRERSMSDPLLPPEERGVEFPGHGFGDAPGGSESRGSGMEGSGVSEYASALGSEKSG